MQNRKTRRLPVVIIAMTLSLLVLVVVLFETAFYHLNPIKVGFHPFDHDTYVVLARALSSSSDYGNIAELMSKNEMSLGLRYHSKVRIILCDKQSDLSRYQPLLSAADKRNAVAVAPWPNTIYITPRAKQEYGTIDGCLGHELSHILLIQNYGPAKAFLLWKLEEWVPEGFATYANKWPNYFSRERLLQKMKEAGVMPAGRNLLGRRRTQEISFTLRYMIYRYFVEYLFLRNPKASVIRFITESCNRPRDMEVAFERNLGKPLEDYENSFVESLNGK